MDIKKIKVICLIILILSFSSFALFGIVRGENEEQAVFLLHDKVHAFPSSNSTLPLTLEFDKDYWYYILIEIVTKHESFANVTVFDPDHKKYHVFGGELRFVPEVMRFYNIPYCAALDGNHTVVLSVINKYTCNIHIKVERCSKALTNIIPDGDYHDPLPPRVTRWKDGMEIVHDMRLKTDTMYNIHITRVSSIADPQKTNCTMNCTIEDPNDLVYSIFLNNIGIKMDVVKREPFGTAIAGLYRLRMRIKCEVEYINIAYAVIEDYPISEVVNSSDTPTEPSGDATPEPVNETEIEDVGDLNTTTNKNITYYIPQEWMIGTVVVLGGFVGTMVIVAVVYRKRNKVNLNG